MKRKLITIGRWVSVLPVFIIVYTVAYLIMYVSYRFWADADSWAMKYFLPMVGSLISGIFSIVYAAKVAPKYKSVVAFILLIIMILFTGGLLFGEFFVVENKNYVNIIAIVISMIGNIIGYQICKNEDEIENF